MWFASLFNNEALISISTVELLHFSHLDFACTSPGLQDYQQELSGGRSQGSPKSSSQFLQAELCQSRAEVAQVGTQTGHLEDVLTPGSNGAYAKKLHSSVGRRVPCAGSTHHRAHPLKANMQHTQGERAQLTPLSWALLGDPTLIWEDRPRYGNALGYTPYSD